MEVLHAVTLKRYEATHANSISDFLYLEEERILKSLSSNEMFNKPISRTTRKQLREQLKKVRRKLAAIDEEAFKKLNRQMREAAGLETTWQRQALQNTFPFPVTLATPEQSILYSAIYSRPFQGANFSDWSRSYSRTSIHNVQRAARIAFFNGEGVEGATRRLIGTRGINSALKQNTNGMRALARTALNHSINQAKDVFHQTNKVAQKFRYTAVLDGRTTLICADRDGRIFKLGERPPLPAHFNCRSTYVAILNEESIIGERQAITSTQTRKKLAAQWRRDARRKAGKSWKDYTSSYRNKLVATERNAWLKTNFGTVPAKTSFSNWFQGQSSTFQKEYLGEQRFALYSKGKLSLNKFIDKVTGEKLTIRQLKRANKDAFRLSGL